MPSTRTSATRPSGRTSGSVTGVAGGSLGTGTAADDETKEYDLREIGWLPSSTSKAPPPGTFGGSTPAPGPVAPSPIGGAMPGVHVASEAAPSPRAVPRSSPGRGGGVWISARTTAIALAAVFMLLLGVVALTGGAVAPAGIAAPPAATATATTGGGGGEDRNQDGDRDDAGDGRGNDGRGNGNEGGGNGNQGGGNGNQGGGNGNQGGGNGGRDGDD